MNVTRELPGYGVNRDCTPLLVSTLISLRVSRVVLQVAVLVIPEAGEITHAS